MLVDNPPGLDKIHPQSSHEEARQIPKTEAQIKSQTV
jgi:hypothetical protein